MTRLLSLALFMLLSVFMTVAFAGDQEGSMETTAAAEPQMCMECMHRTMMCPVDGPEVKCQECKDHMASCEICKTDYTKCPWVAEKMATGCEVCAANMLADIPCADCAKAKMSCNVCAPMSMCATHKAAFDGCEACQAGKTICADHMGAMFLCDDCMAKMVCEEHRDMMRACEKCAKGEDCDMCMNAALACEKCIALHTPPSVEADGATTTDATTTTDDVTATDAATTTDDSTGSSNG